MTGFLEKVRALVTRGEVQVSLHGHEELAADGIPSRDVVDGLSTAVVIEDCPNTPKGRAPWFSSKMAAISRFM